MRASSFCWRLWARSLLQLRHLCLPSDPTKCQEKPPSLQERNPHCQVKHENYPRKIPYISKKVRVWKIAYMKFTYTKFPTENILHIFWVWKIPYKKISYNNLEAYFCNWWTISPWKLTDVIWNWN